MTAQTATLTDFLLARIAEDEAVARSVAWGHPLGAPPLLATHGTLHINPARVLAECAAKRWVVDMFSGNLHEKWDDGHEVAKVADALLRTLASVYVDHPDYRQEWKP